MDRADPKERLAALQVKVNRYDPGSGGGSDQPLVWESIAGALATLNTELSRRYARLVYAGDQTERRPLQMEVIRLLHIMSAREKWRVQKADVIIPGVARILVTEELMYRDDLDQRPEISIRARLKWMDITKQGYHKAQWGTRIRDASYMFNDARDQITTALINMARADRADVNRYMQPVRPNRPLASDSSTVV